MSNVAFVFPGQGTQYFGMARDFYEQFEVSRKVFEKASQVTGIDLAELCFEKNEKLNKTQYTQIALVAAETAILYAVREMGISSQVNAGLSLGEYTAILASKGMKEEDIFTLVRKRGIYMEEAYPSGGAMAAVIGVSPEAVEETCQAVDGAVSIANYNCPGQIVITGEEKAVRQAETLLKEKEKALVVPLNVSGPFHCSLLEPAARQLELALQEVLVHPLETPYVSNTLAACITDSQQIKPLLVRQLVSPVCWQQSMEQMIKDGIDTFIEIGPGKTLTGFLKKTDRNCTGISVGKIKDLDKLSFLITQQD